MKDMGYGKGYAYAHDAPEAYIPQEYLPEALRGTKFYQPGRFGFEKAVLRRMMFWQQLKEGKQPLDDKLTLENDL